MDIEVLSSKDHIKKNISMYVGDVSNKNESIFVFEEEKFKTLNYNGALIKVYSEIIDNALDHILSDNIDEKIIYVDTSSRITITNYSSMKIFGNVKYHDKKLVDACVPKYVIEESFSSTKFDNESNTIGIHGLGIKILPVICEYLRISVCDGTNYYEYLKSGNNIITNNEKNKTIKSTLSDDINKFFEIEYEPYDNYVINDDTHYYYIQRLYECLIYSSYIGKNIDIILNRKKLEYDFWIFIRKFLDEDYYEFKDLRGKYVKDKVNNSEIEIDVFISINKKKKRLTIVNGIFIYQYIPNGIRDKLNFLISKHNGLDKNFNIMDNISIIVILKNSKFHFTGQAKKGISGKINILNLKFDTKFIDSIIKISRKKTVRKDPKTIKKFIVALYPNNKDSCLELIEGDSAQSSLMKGIQKLGSKVVNKYSFLSVTGKINNVSKKKDCEITKTLNDAISTGTYSSIDICTDPDPDGTHIACLLINALLEIDESILDIIKISILPNISCCNQMFYYNSVDLEDHYKNKKKHFPVKHIKGIGTLNSNEIMDIFKNKNKYFYNISYNKESLKYFKNILSVDSKYRKELFNESTSSLKVIDDKIELKSYIKTSLKDFIVYSNMRTIPDIDGFNNLSRKMMYILLKNYNNKNKLSKITSISADIIKEVKYHHGDASVLQSIIRYGARYPTGLNIPFVIIDGEYGSRFKPDDAAAPRYLSGYCSGIMKYIIREEDNIILKYNQDEGAVIEPKRFYPIVPLILVNGAEYIGNGYSTFIPSFNIIDIINNIRSLIKENNYSEMVPYSRGYNGELYLKDDKLYMKGVCDDDNVITEIPKNYKIKQFYEKLDSKSIEYQILDNNSSYIKCKILDDDVDMDKLLLSTKKLNLVLFNSGKIKKFKTIESIFKKYYKIRLSKYEERKKEVIKIKENKILKIKITISIYEECLLNYPESKEKQDLIINKIVKIYGENNNISIKQIFESIKIIELTEDKNLLLKDKLIKEIKYLEVFKTIKAEDIWLSELEDLENGLDNYLQEAENQS